MPAVSQAQQKYMGMELSKERETGSNDTGMSEKQLSDFAGTKRTGLPPRRPTGMRKLTGNKRMGVRRV